MIILKRKVIIVPFRQNHYTFYEIKIFQVMTGENFYKIN